MRTHDEDKFCARGMHVTKITLVAQARAAGNAAIRFDSGLDRTESVFDQGVTAVRAAAGGTVASSLSCRGGATRYGSCHQEGERFRQGSAELPRVVGRGRAVHAVAVSRDVMAWSRGAGAQRGKQWANRKKIRFWTPVMRIAHGSRLRPRLAAWPVCPPPPSFDLENSRTATAPLCTTPLRRFVDAAKRERGYGRFPWCPEESSREDTFSLWYARCVPCRLSFVRAPCWHEFVAVFQHHVSTPRQDFYTKL